MFWRRSTQIRQWLPRLQAHRGFWVEGLQQNSLQSVQEAYRRGYEIAEFDVRITADQIAVLFHDEKYQDKILFQTVYTDFKNLIAPEFADLSKLEDVLIWMTAEKQKKPEFSFKLNIEIKSRKIFDGRLEIEVFKLIEKYDMVGSILISSFNPFTLFRVRKFNSKIFRALLVTRSEESNFLLNSLVLNIFAYPDVLHLRWNDLNQKVIKQVSNKVPLVLWTVNEISEIKKFEGKIYGIISDRITPQEFQKFKTDQNKG